MSEYTLFSHFKYILLHFLTKVFGVSAICTYAETGFIQENRWFQESVGEQKPDFFDAASASPLIELHVFAQTCERRLKLPNTTAQYRPLADWWWQSAEQVLSPACYLVAERI